MSQHDFRDNPDKLRLINYSCKTYNTENFKHKILVGKILTIQHPFVKFVILFHRQSFALYGIYPMYVCYEEIHIPVCIIKCMYVRMAFHNALNFSLEITYPLFYILNNLYHGVWTDQRLPPMLQTICKQVYNTVM